jgi:hypothetical protein
MDVTAGDPLPGKLEGGWRATLLSHSTCYTLGGRAESDRQLGIQVRPSQLRADPFLFTTCTIVSPNVFQIFFLSSLLTATFIGPHPLSHVDNCDS